MLRSQAICSWSPVNSQPKNPGEALVFVHGCCVEFENALRRAAQIAHDIHFHGPTFLFSWPSSGELIDYGEDRETVDLAARHFKEFLEKIVAETKVTKIHFVAHSMGNMVVLEALEKIATTSSTLSPIIGEVINAAPDVDPDLFKTLVSTVKPKAGNFTLYASRNDWALWGSSKIRNRPRAGYIKDKPLIDARNFDTIDITQPGGGWFDFNWLALNHDVYASSPVLVADMEGIIERHQHPPGLRTKEFEPVALQEGTYWLFHRPQAAATDAGTASLPGPSSPTQPTVATPPLATVILPNSTEPPMPLIVTAPPTIASPPSETSTLPPQAEPKAETNQAKLPLEAQAPPLPVPKSSVTTASTLKLAHRKKKYDFDPDWNTKPLR